MAVKPQVTSAGANPCTKSIEFDSRCTGLFSAGPEIQRLRTEVYGIRPSEPWPVWERPQFSLHTHLYLGLGGLGKDCQKLFVLGHVWLVCKAFRPKQPFSFGWPPQIRATWPLAANSCLFQFNNMEFRTTARALEKTLAERK